MFYSQKKIDYIDRDNEEFIISFKDCDLLFKITRHKKGLNISYDGTGLVFDKHVEEIYFEGKLGDDGKYEIKSIIRSPLAFVRNNPLILRDVKSIVLKIDGIYVTIYGGCISKFF